MSSFSLPTLSLLFSFFLLWGVCPFQSFLKLFLFTPGSLRRLTTLYVIQGTFSMSRLRSSICKCVQLKRWRREGSDQGKLRTHFKSERHTSQKAIGWWIIDDIHAVELTLHMEMGVRLQGGEAYCHYWRCVVHLHKRVQSGQSGPRVQRNWVLVTVTHIHALMQSMLRYVNTSHLRVFAFHSKGNTSNWKCFLARTQDPQGFLCPLSVKGNIIIPWMV